MDRGRAIDAGERAQIADEHVAAGLEIGAEIGDDLDAESEERAVAVERQLGRREIVARLRVAEERLGARADPFDRTPDRLRAKQHERHLVIDRGLHAEAAADVAGDDADAAFRDLQHRMGQLGAEIMGALQGRVDGVAILDGVVFADRAARLHGGAGDAVDDEIGAHHAMGAGEGGIGLGLVAFEMDEADIVRAIVPHARRARCDRVLAGNHGRQRLVIDLDQLGRVGRLGIGLGHDEGDVIADPAHAVLDQRRKARAIERRAVAPLRPGRHRQIAPARRLPIGAGEDGEHARRVLGPRGVDLADARMGVAGAQHIAISHARQHHVVDIAAAAAQEPRILEARHALAKRELSHQIFSATMICSTMLPSAEHFCMLRARTA